jgi:hypothetical protein
MENIKKISNITSNIKNIINSDNYVMIFLIVSIIVLVVLVVFYIKAQITKDENNNESMTKDLEKININIKNINMNDAAYQHNLRDYYIMSSYNTCSNGNFNNSYVSLKALRNVIKRGARVLDFEIYSVDNETVVACSYNENYYQKGSYNSIKFSKVMNLVNDLAFSASTCPNFNDPLILHFRIKSNIPKVYDDMSNILVKAFKHHILGPKYNYQGNGENIGRVSLKELLGKVIFVCDKTNEVFINSGLNEVINMTSGGEFLKKYRSYDIEYTHNYKEIINSNKKNMAITMPDLTTKSNNMNSSIHMKYGCQMICMNYQNKDSNLEFYIDQFNKNGSAFMLKPLELRYIPVTIDTPKPQNKELSYANKTISEPYFKHEI